MCRVDCCEPQAGTRGPALTEVAGAGFRCCQSKSPYSWANGILVKVVKAAPTEASVDMAPYSLPPYMEMVWSGLLWHQVSPIWF